MIIPLDKLFAVNTNKYIFTRAAMDAVEKLDYIEEIPEDQRWKVVPNILKVMSEKQLKYDLSEEDAEK